MKQKVSMALILALMLMFTISPNVFAQIEATPILIIAPAVNVIVDDRPIDFEHPPILENGRTLVPYDSIDDMMKVKPTWDKESNKVVIDGDYTSIVFTMDDKTVYVHRKYDFTGIPEEVTLDVAPRIINNIPYIPLRFTAEKYDAEVTWEGATKTVIIKNAVITPVETPATYKILTRDDIKGNEVITSWYEENHMTIGVTFKTFGEDTYVIISAGEKPTAGYSIEIESATIVSPGYVYFTAIVKKPAPDMMVANVITYPHLLLKLATKADKVEGEIYVYNSDMTEKDLPFVKISDEDIKENEEIVKWVEENNKTKGIHYRRFDKDLYALVAAGEQKSGGYIVDVMNVVSRKADEAYIYAAFYTPLDGDIVTMALTYPYCLIRIDDETIKHVDGDIKIIE